VASYEPMTLADLAAHLLQTTDRKIRWKIFREFLEEYRWGSADTQPALLVDDPPSVGDERWDALLAALAEHLAAKYDLAPPGWTALRVLGRPWFPAELRVRTSLPGLLPSSRSSSADLRPTTTLVTMPSAARRGDSTFASWIWLRARASQAIRTSGISTQVAYLRSAASISSRHWANRCRMSATVSGSAPARRAAGGRAASFAMKRRTAR